MCRGRALASLGVHTRCRSIRRSTHFSFSRRPLLSEYGFLCAINIDRRRSFWSMNRLAVIASIVIAGRCCWCFHYDCSCAALLQAASVAARRSWRMGMMERRCPSWRAPQLINAMRKPIHRRMGLLEKPIVSAHDDG